MPSHVFADRPVPQPPERGTVDALIARTRLLRGDMDAVRRDAVADDDDVQGRWQRALCDLALHHLDDLGAHLGQLKEGLPAAGPESPAGGPSGHGAHAHPLTGPGPLLGRVGSADWDLLTDEVSWSEELYEIFGRPPESGPLSLDELPSVVLPDDQPRLTAMVTDCLVDGRPIDGEFRIRRPDETVRTLHMMGEPVLDSDGCTASMWAVLRDVSDLRRSERTVRESEDSLQRRQQIARTERQVAVELQEAVLPPWRGPVRLPQGGPAVLDLAAHYLPSAAHSRIGGDWYDAMELPDGQSLLTVGDLTGHGVGATSAVAMLLGALRGMALAGVAPGALMGHLDELLDASAQPALGSALCCRYDPAARTLTWAQSGHPAPVLFRQGVGTALTPPSGVLLGAMAGTAYGQAQEQLRPGDVLVLHTGGLTAHGSAAAWGEDGLLALAPRFAAAGSAQECMRPIIEECGHTERQEDACVLVARVGGK
ncbi:PP2C family protein-serine/threonine phosphatase [Streptomyces sp. NBC_00859]|uniref:PP2C family protein-serine/threonine phosphatase n=1 Tax=Streptomyces sp. NBC_00859 TaxID=2903682 RepID=UPI003868B08C|nr:SpoIIE family protein phosphatase [Streptomyces sp. NBC_00859]